MRVETLPQSLQLREFTMDRDVAQRQRSTIFVEAGFDFNVLGRFMESFNYF